MWTCGRSSLFLQRVLQEDYSVEAIWMTGCPRDANGQPFPAGFHKGEQWLGHSWVVASDFIVDITADQFDLAPVIMLPESDPRYQSSADLALAEYRSKRAATLEMLWPLWRSQERL
jgi:hypothetical protein